METQSREESGSLTPIILNVDNIDTKLGLSAVIDIGGVDRTAANALINIILTSIRTMSISEVEIIHNSSSLQDDHLAHRLTTIPIKLDPDLFDTHRPGDEYNATNSSCLELEREFDAPHGENMTIRVGELTWSPKEGQTADMEPEFLSPTAPIIFIREGSVVLKAYVTKGTQAMKSSFRAASSVRYHPKMNIYFKEEVTGRDAKELEEVCPGVVFDLEDIGTAKVARPLRCINCLRCLEIDGMSEKLVVDADETVFQFQIDSVGALTPEVIMKKAIIIYVTNPSKRTVMFPTSTPKI